MVTKSSVHPVCISFPFTMSEVRTRDRSGTCGRILGLNQTEPGLKHRFSDGREQESFSPITAIITDSIQPATAVMLLPLSLNFHTWFSAPHSHSFKKTLFRNMFQRSASLLILGAFASASVDALKLDKPSFALSKRQALGDGLEFPAQCEEPCLPVTSRMAMAVVS